MVTPESDDTLAGNSSDPYIAQPFLREQLSADPPPTDDAVADGVGERRGVDADDAAFDRIEDSGVVKSYGADAVLRTLARGNRAPAPKLPADIRASLRGIKRGHGRFHGAKFSLAYFPFGEVFADDADKFGYMTSDAVRAASRLDVTDANKDLLKQLGFLLGNSGRETAAESATPAGYTYVGQFVDHDITLDVSSDIESPTVIDANVINNLRSPSLDLDSLYGRGPAQDAFMYTKAATGEPDSTFRFVLGVNLTRGANGGIGGPGGPAGPTGMIVHTDFDIPRASTKTPIVGDPRNNENLIVSQLHHAMLRFHNAVVGLELVRQSTLPPGPKPDVFVEAKKSVIRHYQHAVLHDFLVRICGQAAVDDALANVTVAPDAPFRMPVEFSVAAYRFGHSMVRDQYFVNFVFPTATMTQVFEFASADRTPVFSNWVVDFNAFFETGVPVVDANGVPHFNHARKIDSVLATALEDLDANNSFAEFLGVLAARNLQRGLVLGLPSGQAAAKALGVPVMTSAELTKGLPKDEVAVLKKENRLLLRKTPLWYYVLRESMVKADGEHLGPLGAKIVADTFVTILKRNKESILNLGQPFTPTLPSDVPGTFTFTDIIKISGVNLP